MYNYAKTMDAIRTRKTYHLLKIKKSVEAAAAMLNSKMLRAKTKYDIEL